MMKSFNYLLLFSFAILACAALVSSLISNAVVPKLPMYVYYEPLNPQCMAFVTTQLFPSMTAYDRWRYVNLTLVPYGNAKLIHQSKNACQRGSDEREMNAWHACILQHNNMTMSLKLITCMMHSRQNNLDKCAKQYNINVSAVKNCKKCRHVNDILWTYDEESKSINYTGVPFITFDNKFDSDDQEMLADCFDEVFCAKYKAKFNIDLENC